MRVLFVSRWFPYPPVHGSKQRVFHLISALAATHEVSLVSFADDPSIEPDAPAIQSLCAGMHIVPWQGYASRSPSALLGLLASTPRSIAATYSTEMAARVREVCDTWNPSVVVASQITSASYHAAFAPRPAVFDEVELGVFADQVQRAPHAIARARHSLTWMKLGRYLTRVLRTMDACTVVSEAEAALVRRAVLNPPRLEVVPNGTTVPPEIVPLHERASETLIFTGALTYAANADAMRWFLQQCYPLIKERRPAATLRITGVTGGLRMGGAGVLQTGHVADARALVAQTAVSIAPLQWGGGTRLKLLEAMAVGTPIVATSKAAEGLAVAHDVHLLLADSPQDFAAAVLHLLDDGALRQRLVENARQLVVERYQWSSIGRAFVSLLENVAERGGGM